MQGMQYSEENSQVSKYILLMNYPTLHTEDLEKEEQIKPKTTKKEIIKIRDK